ncbi:hypothetical protein [Halocatena halophila]|uniref:hypothetical protein n=1 Tax=Halocatena halophila TaxID=2814576 RepID=UPI002ED32174
MNKHYSDAWYYIKRAGEELVTGLSESTTTAEMKARDRLGMEPKSDTETQTDRLKEELESIRTQTEEESERLFSHAREQIEDIQQQLQQQNHSQSKGILK